MALVVGGAGLSSSDLQKGGRRLPVGQIPGSSAEAPIPDLGCANYVSIRHVGSRRSTCRHNAIFGGNSPRRRLHGDQISDRANGRIGCFAVCSPQSVILLSVSRWCTVTVTDPDGRRHSLDVLADSTYDAAHLFVVEAKKERAVGLPKPTLATIFEVVASGKVYRVAGTALQRWIVERRQQWNGPKGYMFSKRPGLE